MKENNVKRIGIIGYGQIGSSLCEMIQNHSGQRLEMAFVHESDNEAAKKIPDGLRLDSLSDIGNQKVDLVVEAAHPEFVRQHGSTVLKQTSLMIMSVSALGDPALEERLRKDCREHHTRLYIPHGATLGLDGLRDGLSIWEEVSITMRKNPRNLDFTAAPHLEPESSKDAVTIYDGPARGILSLFPKNVNSHATLSIATLGLDKTRSILISDPALDESVIEIDATGEGTRIHIERRNPIKGVTGKLTLLSAFQSLRNALSLDNDVRIC
jgi:aspartate dehydrogenase